MYDRLAWGSSTLGFAAARRIQAAFAATIAALSLLAVPAVQPDAAGTIRVIVAAMPGSAADAVASVVEAGGRILRPLGIIEGFAAEIPAGAFAGLDDEAGIRLIVPDRSAKPYGLQALDAPGKISTTPELTDTGALSAINDIVGSPALWAQGFTGAGVDVALIDTGVAPVPGLQAERVVNGPDLSFDYQVGGPASLDAYGHGTHMAGIIAGRDDGITPAEYDTTTGFVGVAPGARIVNVKVGAFNGATDVSQVIAAIDWVVQHRNDNGLNIRVLNLSFGTDGTQDYRYDPLAYAVEVAWRKGIIVVAAAGNDGTEAQTLANPALHPAIIAVGAADPRRTIDRRDDIVPEWASRGTPQRHVDFVAPGVSVLSLAVPGSYVATTYPASLVSDRFMKGSGTSQAAAVASGLAALLVSKYPSASPDAIKTLLMATAYPMAGDSAIVRGRGIVDGAQAAKGHAALPSGPSATPTPTSSGTGSLELARGTSHVGIDGDVLTGERDIFGVQWDGRQWAADAWDGQSWSGGMWRGQSWSGQSWSGQSWSGASWENAKWTGQSWSGQSWSGQSWSGQSWSGQSWSGQSWSGQSWSGQSWSGQSWSGQSWSGQRWSSVDW